ncbi:uncharacterized protein Triagg1_4790 [Trichoderma aggressivum f. europaeum]|uniref:Uncharacterized protein n=1 Tax=Trichoderma aggressivum f. europaeum TaxID=173218 RepID=A0AAE1IFJ7_9HYPO|nr:hypothetical protein Triagg1_4790 [Trichoderma aggressivum f. europaeum]
MPHLVDCCAVHYRIAVAGTGLDSRPASSVWSSALRISEPVCWPFGWRTRPELARGFNESEPSGCEWTGGQAGVVIPQAMDKQKAEAAKDPSRTWAKEAKGCA